MTRLTEVAHLSITGWHLLIWIALAGIGVAWIMWGVMNFGWYVRDLLMARADYYRAHTPPSRSRHRAQEER